MLNKRFSLADALIIILAAAFIIGAAVLYMLPRSEEAGGDKTRVSLQIQLHNTPEGISKGDAVFYSGIKIGTVTNVDGGFYIVIIDADLEKSEAGYSAQGDLLRINGAFLLETKTVYARGTVIAIEEREG